MKHDHRPRIGGSVAPTLPAPALDLDRLRLSFPALAQQVHGHSLIYLDNAATTLKPRAVIDALTRYYASDNANVHRGVHALSDRATALYDAARETVRAFLNAGQTHEVIFVRGTTEAINLVAQTFGRQRVESGDEVVITALEHHANIVPWQLLCQEKGARLTVAPITDAGDLDLDRFEKCLNPRVKLVAVSHASNVLGTVNPVRELAALAHARGIPILVDGAQAAAHLTVDVRALDCDFYAFSGHKVYGPMGIGALYGKTEHLEAMPPWQGGGDMIRSVSFEGSTFAGLPNRFEAGTPNVADAVGLAAAIEELNRWGRAALAEHEQAVLAQAVARLGELPGVRLIGRPARRVGVVSFVVDDPPLAAFDVGTRLDLQGIAVRTGHHCCQPLIRRLGIEGTIRASFGIYNSAHEVDQLASAVRAIQAGESSGRNSVAVALPARDETEPAYPAATAPSVAEAAALLLDEFDALGDWPERYEYLIELGRRLPPLPDEFHTEAHRVRGCQSIVYLAARVRPGTADVVEFLAESNSGIVRGLLAVLQRLLSGQRAGDLLDFDLPEFFRRIGLAANLTAGRRNGLQEMVKRLRAFAQEVVETSNTLAPVR